MKAVRRTSRGVAELQDVELDAAGGDEVVVDVEYAGVNPFDLQVLRGEIGADPSRPLTLGAEATGRLDGRLVHISGAGLGAARHGTFAARATVPSAAVTALPDGVDPAAAATVGVAGKTAWRAVHQLAAVTADDVVLVLGGAGGVGLFAAQLASAAGAHVVAVVGSASKAATLDELGIRALVAATAQALAEQVADTGATVVLDPLGGQYVAALLTSLAPRARVVTYGVLAGHEAALDLRVLYSRGISVLGTSGGTTPPDERAAALAGALAAVELGDVVVPTEVLALDDAVLAFERLTARTVVGKLLLAP